MAEGPQQQRRLDATPGRFAAVGDLADAPGTKTALYSPTAAQTRGEGQQIAALGEALGSFFNASARTLAHVNQASQREELVQIERENHALSLQAGVDHAAGKQKDPRYLDRQAYAGAYETAAADDHALDLNEGLRAKFATLDLSDPNLNLHGIAEEYYRENVGKGTGQGQYDARLLQRYTSASQSLIQQYAEGQRSTIQSNARAELIQSATRQVLSPTGITAPQLADLRERLTYLTHGDRSAADKLLMTSLSGQQNAFQGDAILRSMQELGMDASEPELFNNISGQVWKNQSTIKTRDAGVALQNWRMDLAAEQMKYPHGVLPLNRVSEFAQRALAIDGVHGVGLDRFNIDQLMVQSAKQKVRVNVLSGIDRGAYGNADLAAASRANGDSSPVETVKKDFQAYMNESLGGDPDFNATRDDLGNVRPLLTAESSTRFGIWTAQRFGRFGMSPWDKETEQRVAAGLTGNSIDGIRNSYLALRAARDAGVSRDNASQFFGGNAAAEAHFNGLDMLVRAGIPIEQAAKAQVEHYYDQRELDDAAKSGDITGMIARVLGPAAGKNREEIAKELAEAQKAAILDSTDRKKFWGSVNIAVAEQDRVPLQGAMLKTAMLWRDAGYSGNLKDLAKSAVGGAGKWVVYPGAGGGLTAYRNSFGDLGLSLAAPINHTGQLSTEKGYRPIMAFGAKVINAAGEVEDTLATFREDSERALKTFPGKFTGDADKFYVDRQGPDGLALLHDSNGMVPMFRPGEPITLGGKAVKVPVDPSAAADFFRDHFQDSGFMFKQDGAPGPDGQTWQAYYAPRVKMDERARDKAIRNRSPHASGPWWRGNDSMAPDIPGVPEQQPNIE
ncbi:hypothetical protein [Achromobacter sp. DH1f]|uniref:hypothetical protein n=1 Tax=Achromobacter sp. DH1f TaxID=1397275 RepID=UPI00046A4306|nr:hypothetical protein [Achromobacter sp. DH1f]